MYDIIIGCNAIKSFWLAQKSVPILAKASIPELPYPHNWKIYVILEPDSGVFVGVMLVI